MASQGVHAGTTVQVPFSTEKQRLQMALCTLGNKWTRSRPPNARFSVNSSSCNYLCSCLIRDCAMFGERKTGKLSSVKRPLWNDLWFTSRKQTGRSCGRRRACFAPPTTPVNGTCSPTRPILTATMSDPAPSTGTDSKSGIAIIARILNRYFCRGTLDRSLLASVVLVKVNVIVKGKVQGVFFRKWTVEAAQKLGLNGWVRNLADGSVEAVISGPSGAVDNMIQQCHSGPSSAQVSSVEVSKWDNDVPQGFEKRMST